MNFVLIMDNDKFVEFFQDNIGVITLKILNITFIKP